MPKSEDTLTDYLLKDEKNSEVKIFKTPVKGGVKIVTKYRVLEERTETSLLEVELITGKTHQIRAHLASYGHFIIGDGKYGKESVNRRMGAGRQRLTAYKLVLHFDSGALKYLDGKTTEIDYATGRLHP